METLRWNSDGNHFEAVRKSTEHCGNRFRCVCVLSLDVIADQNAARRKHIFECIGWESRSTGDRAMDSVVYSLRIYSGGFLRWFAARVDFDGLLWMFYFDDLLWWSTTRIYTDLHWASAMRVYWKESTTKTRTIQAHISVAIDIRSLQVESIWIDLNRFHCSPGFIVDYCGTIQTIHKASLLASRWSFEKANWVHLSWMMKRSHAR